MKKELQDKLFKDHPLLFCDRNKSMQNTCMCWGIDCGDGWYNLLYECASKLEPIIQNIINDRLNEGYTECYNCSCDVLDHKPGLNDNMPCTKIHHLPYRFGVWRHIQNKWYQKINRIAQWLYNKFNIGYDKPCHCKEYELSHPRASQIKEKYGSLSFYMTSYTDEINKIINEAERKSEKTCEYCGKPGKLRDDGWLFTLCDECEAVRQKTGRAPWLE